MPKTKTERLRAMGSARPVGVDRETNTLRGYVVAQLGPFKSEGRGEFDQAGLEEIVRLGNSTKQLKSRFGHATMCDSALGKYLGRPQNFRMGEAVAADGTAVPAVRADLPFDPTALDVPPGGGKPLGVYIMDLAESNPGALSSSLVLQPKKSYRKNDDGTLATDEAGDPLPPLWFPERLMGSDIVDVGDAVDDLLSTESLPNGYLWEATDLLDNLFPGKTREELHEILTGWTSRYLDGRYGPKAEDRSPADLNAKLAEAAVGVARALADSLAGLGLRRRRNRAAAR